MMTTRSDFLFCKVVKFVGGFRSSFLEIYFDSSFYHSMVIINIHSIDDCHIFHYVAPFLSMKSISLVTPKGHFRVLFWFSFTKNVFIIESEWFSAKSTRTFFFHFANLRHYYATQFFEHSLPYMSIKVSYGHIKMRRSCVHGWLYTFIKLIDFLITVAILCVIQLKYF